MKTFLIACCMAFSMETYGQAEKLSKRLEEIKKLQIYDNTVVMYSDSFRIKLYHNDEYRFNAYHPYQYLRDSASVNDLKTLLTFDHPFIRTYAFAALAKRNSHSLFDFVLDNLHDTTRMYIITDDYGYATTPPDMMLHYIADSLVSWQKDIISDLILTKYHHLKTLDEVLLFHKKNAKYYPFIKMLATKGTTADVGLVALAQYQQEADIPLIKAGFKRLEYFSGVCVFFKAIEDFNHKAFDLDMISLKDSILKENSLESYLYYIAALAKFRNQKGLDILSSFVDQQQNNSEYYRRRNIAIIYSALKKYYVPIYDTLIADLERKVDKEELESYDNHLDQNPWSY